MLLRWLPAAANSVEGENTRAHRYPHSPHRHLHLLSIRLCMKQICSSPFTNQSDLPIFSAGGCRRESIELFSRCLACLRSLGALDADDLLLSPLRLGSHLTELNPASLCPSTEVQLFRILISICPEGSTLRWRRRWEARPGAQGQSSKQP